jgi:surfeit locus 1 family protein
MRALLSPRMLLLHLVAIASVAGTGWLGVWQYGAWADHRDDKADALAHAAPKPLADVLGPDDPFPSKYVGQPVRLAGTWLPDDTVFIEGKAVQGKDGYWVVTPVSTDNGSAVLVVRGWSEDAEAPVAQGNATITGWIQPGEASGDLDQDATDDVLPSLRIADVLERMDQDLYGAYVIAEEPVEASLTPVTPDQLPKPDTFTSIRNLLYGIEWWVFGGFAVFLWWRWCKDEVERVTSVTAGEEAAEPEVPSSA